MEGFSDPRGLRIRTGTGRSCPKRENFILASVQTAKQTGQRELPHEEQRWDAHDLGDGFGERAVAVLHGVHLNPGNATPADDALAGRFERDARDGVLGDDHRTPFLDPASGPDPHRVAGVDGCWLIDRTPPPIVAPAACY